MLYQSVSHQEELDRSFTLPHTPGVAKQSLYESLRQSGAANLLENLQAQLKLREGEITHLQVRPGCQLLHTAYAIAVTLTEGKNGTTLSPFVWDHFMMGQDMSIP